MDLNLLNMHYIKNANINIPLAKEKKLINNEDYSLYQLVYAFYQKGLDSFLLHKSRIKNFNSQIRISDLNFGVMPENHKNPFHLCSYLHLEYIYIRNFLFIEKLSIDDLQYFFEKLNSHDTEIDEKILSIVENTFKEVIKDNFRKGKYLDESTTCFGAFIPSNIISSSALVIVIQYGKNKEKLERKEFLENQVNKNVFLDTIAREIETCLQANLSVDVKALVRDFVGE